MIEQHGNQLNFRPDARYFYDLKDEAISALRNIVIVTVPKQGVKALFSELRSRKIKPAYGSLRLDRDVKGELFIQEYRPSKNILRRGYFISLDRAVPLWNSIGTLIIRLYKKLQRQAEQQSVQDTIQDSTICLILQGSLDRKYIELLLDQGRFSFNTQANHIIEEPVFESLEILSRISADQVLEVELPRYQKFDSELNDAVLNAGKELTDVACVVGKDRKGDFYVAAADQRGHFIVHSCKYKLVPIEIARAIKRAGKKLSENKRMLLLDNVNMDVLLSCLKDRQKYYFENRFN
jgi:hypothetical protein